MLFLAQSDTTAGFLSQSESKINLAKGREKKKVLLEVESLATLKDFVRIPQKHKNLIRRSSKTTFIYPNSKAYRVIKDPYHLRFLQTFKWMYSSSANPTKKGFDPLYATQKAEVIIKDKRGIYESIPSKIYKINQAQIKRIR